MMDATLSLLALLGAILFFSSSFGNDQIPELDVNSSARALSQKILGEENVMFSPIGIESALLLLAGDHNPDSCKLEEHDHLDLNACRDCFIKDRVAKALGIADFSTYNERLGKTIETLRTNNIMEVDNSIWLNQDRVPCIVEEAFRIKTIHSCSSPTNLFAERYIVGDLSAVPTINNWVFNRTKGRIKKIIDDNRFTFAYVNTVYFKDKWKTEFDKCLTSTDKFYNIDGTEGSADYMLSKSKYNVAFCDEFSAVEIPYASKNASMYAFLPKDGYSTKDFCYNWVDEAISKQTETDITLYLPKFRSQTSLNLSDILNLFKIGDSSVFSNNFDIVHKTFVDVDESGTEATAATAIITRMSYNPDQPMEKIVKFDRPFVYLVKENFTGKVLFMGAQCKF